MVFVKKVQEDVEDERRERKRKENPKMKGVFKTCQTGCVDEKKGRLVRKVMVLVLIHSRDIRPPRYCSRHLLSLPLVSVFLVCLFRQ